MLLGLSEGFSLANQASLMCYFLPVIDLLLIKNPNA